MGAPKLHWDSKMNFESKLVRAEVRIDICVHKVVCYLVLGVLMALGL